MSDIVLVTHPFNPPAIAPDGTGPCHLAVLTRAHSEPFPWSNGVLCHSTPEMATERDLVIRDRAPWPLVVCAELHIQILPEQVVKRFGACLSDDEVSVLRGALPSDGESLGGFSPRAMPLGGPVDPRWRWMQEWAPVARDLSSQVRSLLLD